SLANKFCAETWSRYSLPSASAGRAKLLLSRAARSNGDQQRSCARRRRQSFHRFCLFCVAIRRLRRTTRTISAIKCTFSAFSLRLGVSAVQPLRPKEKNEMNRRDAKAQRRSKQTKCVDLPQEPWAPYFWLRPTGRAKVIRETCGSTLLFLARTTAPHGSAG